MNNKGKKCTEDFLEHYGILGMKWGRRKGNASSVRKAGARRPGSESEDYKEKTKLLKKKVSEMSTDELQKLSRRFQLEKQYAELTKKQISPGRKFVTDILVTVGKQQMTAYLNKVASQKIEAMIARTAS